MLRHSIRQPLFLAGLMAGTLSLAGTPASAQLFEFSFGGGGIAPSRVPALVRGMGMEPAGPVFREGPTAFSVQAYDRNGRRVRVVIDAREGETIAVEPLAGPAQISRAAPLPRDYRGPGVYLDDEDDETYRLSTPGVPAVQSRPVDRPAAKKPEKPPVVAARPTSPAETVPAAPVVKPVPVPAQAAPAKPATPPVAAKTPEAEIMKPVTPAPVVIPPAAVVAPSVAPAPATVARPDNAPTVTQLPGGQGVRIVGPASPYSPKKDDTPKAAEAAKPAAKDTVLPPANGLDFD